MNNLLADEVIYEIYLQTFFVANGDGVHPTPMGHEYIKNEWIKAFNNLKGVE
ncbi:MAG: hypothetical protein J6A69_00685 [Clostridia bacterium]|nr:hypothetical protein [Clostridia bacterium]